jgi:hypothetical protein
MDTKRKVMVGAVGLVAAAAISFGIGLPNASSASPPKPAVTQSVPTKATTSAPATTEDPAGTKDTDNVQSGDQTTPDKPGTAEAKEAPESSSEKAGAEDPNEPAQPGGGHADATDQADTQQEGVH